MSEPQTTPMTLNDRTQRSQFLAKLVEVMKRQQTPRPPDPNMSLNKPPLQ